MNTEYSIRSVTVTLFNHEHGSCVGTHLPGTGEVVHLANSYITHQQRGKGLGSQYHQERLNHLIDDEKVTLVTCIIRMDNEPQVKILKKNGWKFLHEFNSMYNEPLCLCVRDVRVVEYDPNQQPDGDEDV